MHRGFTGRSSQVTDREEQKEKKLRNLEGPTRGFLERDTSLTIGRLVSQGRVARTFVGRAVIDRLSRLWRPRQIAYTEGPGALQQWLPGRPLSVS
jgi:hypothetical protein